MLSDVQQLVRGGGYGYAKVTEDAPTLSSAKERLPIYARVPSTHQELLARFDTISPIDTTVDRVRVTGSIALEELSLLLGDGREGFQVIALPHLSGGSTG